MTYVRAVIGLTVRTMIQDMLSYQIVRLAVRFRASPITGMILPLVIRNPGDG